MVLYAQKVSRPLDSSVLASMFEARKRVFVDLLKWDLPVLEGRFEMDQFDDEHAVYLIVLDDDGRHAGSARLLETERPHILDTLFPQLCAGDPPRDARTREITRFCLDRSLGARDRLMVRNRLVSALVDHALDHGIRRYTGVAEMGWLQQILAFGWECRPLGPPGMCRGTMIGALAIELADNTPALLAGNGIYRPAVFEADALLEAA